MICQESQNTPINENTRINTNNTGFNTTAKLKVYKFNDACTQSGKLHLSVIYDTNLAGLLTITSPTKALKIQIPLPVKLLFLLTHLHIYIYIYIYMRICLF